MAKPNIVTPHAAIIVWNYKDRLGSDPTKSPNRINATIISTLSCISLETNKSKSSPQGTFRMVLAPTKNWVSTITAGSWCAILMSNDPITAQDFRKADPNKVKMFGKIESVRCETTMGEDGARRTQYLVSGVDWGYIFNNIIYIDPHITVENEPLTLGQGTASALQQLLFGDQGVARHFDTATNLRSIINVFGKTIRGLTEQGRDINRLANASYTFAFPKEMSQYFGFIGPDGKKNTSLTINNLLSLVVGSLTNKDKYSNTSESEGFIDPFSIQGSHSFWQVLLENSNQALNEMLCEIRWESKGPMLTLYNRIKPFSFKGFGHGAGASNNLKSYFQYLPSTVVDDNRVVRVNAGTNWRDKYNFIEIKPQFQDFSILQNWYKQKSQTFDPDAFQREGFRPLIVETKQFPIGTVANKGTVDYNQLASWNQLLREWHFDTHRMLNGTISFVGMNEYISVGSNIKFNAGLLNPTPNLTAVQLSKHQDTNILAHVENVTHTFTVQPTGAREFMTTVQFVRGLIVDSNNIIVGQGIIDKDATSLDQTEEKNSKNTFATSDNDDPDPNKVKGK